MTICSQMSSANDVYNWVEFSLADKFSIGRLTHFPDNQLVILTPPTLRQKRVIKGLFPQELYFLDNLCGNALDCF